MIITDEAKVILEKMLADENKNALDIQIIGYGCHSQLYIDFTIVSDAPTINGIFVQMEPDVEDALEEVTLDAVNGSLYFSSANSGCSGCGGGCSGGCGEGCESCEGGCSGDCGSCN